jgi:hypothetical protein
VKEEVKNEIDLRWKQWSLIREAFRLRSEKSLSLDDKLRDFLSFGFLYLLVAFKMVSVTVRESDRDCFFGGYFCFTVASVFPAVSFLDPIFSFKVFLVGIC